VKRADEDADPGMIGDRVVSDIINAELVIADLTDLNPNAFYELGIRHSTEKPTIHIAKQATPLPFDNVAHRTIFVDLTDWQSIESARNRLADSARTIKEPGFRVSNPITQANASFKMRQSDDPRDRFIATMQERLSSLEQAISSSKEIDLSEFPPELKKQLTQIGEDIEAEGKRLWHAGEAPKGIEEALTKFASDRNYLHIISRIRIDAVGNLVADYEDFPSAQFVGNIRGDEAGDRNQQV
jgi:hypothetical protein